MMLFDGSNDDEKEEIQLVVEDNKTKHAAHSSENDQAKLLSDGDEKAEEYTDIFANGRQSGEFVDQSNLEEGDSTTASDNEVMGYTGDAESYVDDEDEESNILTDVPIVKEGTLINVLDDEELLDDSKETALVDTPIENSLTNDFISDIASKLEETSIQYNVKPGGPVKVETELKKEYLNDLGFKESESDATSAKESEGQVLQNNENKNYTINQLYIDDDQTTNLRKKKLKKRTKSHVDNDELNSSIEVLNELNLLDNQPNSNNSLDLSKKHKRKTHRKVVHNKHRETKLIDIETPPQTPSHNIIKETSLVTNITSKQPKKRISTRNKRKRSRHKIYLDDPDVHQLINDHVCLLQKYLEDIRTGKSPTSKESSLSKKKHHNNAKSMPNVSFVGVSPKGNNYQTMKSAASTQSMGPYDRHKSVRGKNLITRIRDVSSSESSDTDHYERNYGKENYTGPTSKKGTSMLKANEYEICPDCGEQHSPDENEIDDTLNEICPDCGVAHNPYQHTPSPSQKPWQKYVDAVKPGQKYEQLSTEQDPEDEEQKDPLPSIEGPHTIDELTAGYRYKVKYLGSSQITTQHPVTKETRMQQAQDAYNRIKGQGGDDDDDEDDVSTNVDMMISLERIKIINTDTKFEDIMMDHALRTVCFVCDMGHILVLMARRLTSDHSTDFSLERGKPISLGTIVGDKEKKTSKNICHVFECEVEATKIAKAIGQAFNIAYRQFLQSNGISHEHVEEAEYCHVLEAQKLVGADLDKLTDKTAAREIVVVKKRGEWLGIMLLESGWGSMLPTVFIAHLANYSPATICQQLSVGDHILSVNGASLVGLPLSECTTILKNTRSSNQVVLKIVSCPPVVDVVVSRPDVKYQLGFSVQNGTICSLLRGGIAERGGIRVGHRIIEINGDSVVAKSHQYIVDILANTIGSISLKTMPVAMYRLMVGDDQPQHI